MSAAAVRVVVHRSAERDARLQGERRDLRARNRRILLYTSPFLLAGLIIRGRALIRQGQGDLLGTVVVGGFTVLLIAALTAWLLKRQKARATKIPGRLWCSAMAFYPGPYDDDGGEGLSGSADFARRHRANTAAPIVRLVLTRSTVEIVPTRGKNEPLSCALDQLREVSITQAGRRDSGVTITDVDGRSATFLVKPDDELAHQLKKLGASVSHE